MEYRKKLQERKSATFSLYKMQCFVHESESFLKVEKSVITVDLESSETEGDFRLCGSAARIERSDASRFS